MVGRRGGGYIPAMERMQAAWYEKKGAARDVLRIGELPKPEPGPGEVLVAVRASGVNPSDTKSRGGARGNLAMPFPSIVPHQDGAGIVEAVGPGVPESRIGERVWLYEAQLGRPWGTAAQSVALPAERAVPMPDGLGFVEAACLGVPALTAHRCVFADGPVAGKTVLVTGGAGAVGFYAVQLAARAGARVVATVGGEAQAETARRAGADLVIDRRRPGLVEAIGERSVDRIVEVAFGANLAHSLRLLKPNGTIATYSSDAEPEPALPFWPLVMLDATVRFVLVYAMDGDAHRAAIGHVGRAAAEGWLKHDVGAVLPLDRIAEAHERVEAGGGVGKTVLEIA